MGGKKAATPADWKRENRALRRRITALKAETERYRRQLQGLKRAVETMQLGVTLKDVRGRILYSNPAEARMHGYEPEELQGRPGRVLGSPENYRRMTEAEIKRMTSWRRERINLRKDGARFPVQLMSDVVMDGRGRPVEIITTCEDISERCRMEKALRRGEADLRALLDALPDPLFHIAADGTFLSCTAARVGDLALPPEALLGKKVRALFPAPVARKYMDHIRRALDSGVTVEFEYRIRVPLPDGPEQDHACRMSPCGSGEVAALVRDVTDRKRAEEDRKKSWEHLHKTLEATVGALAATVEKRDPYTAGHMRRSTQLACAIAALMGLSESEVEGLRVAGLLHDIGKISVPAEILAKPGRLSEGEMILIRAHAQAGYDILAHIDFPWPVARIILEHHERMDGTGYPNGLTRDAILPQARILAVADVVEAMISHRPYRPTRGRDIALSEITREKGKLYDPEAADACLFLFKRRSFAFKY